MRLYHLQLNHMQLLPTQRTMDKPSARRGCEVKSMYRLSNSLPYLLARVGIRMGDLFVRVVKQEGLTLPMYRVLASLAEQEQPLRLVELSALTSADLSTLSRFVADMHKAGFVSRERPANDQRSLQVELTPGRPGALRALHAGCGLLRRSRDRRAVAQGRRGPEGDAQHALQQSRPARGRGRKRRCRQAASSRNGQPGNAPPAKGRPPK